MPVYEFKCKDCGEIHSELRKMGDFTCNSCPNCGSDNCTKVFSLFSGSGGGGDKSCGSCSVTPGSHS